MRDDHAVQLDAAKASLTVAMQILDDLGEDHAALRVQHALDVIGSSPDYHETKNEISF